MSNLRWLRNKFPRNISLKGDLNYRGNFRIQFNNGVWKIFDIRRYEDCEIFASYKLALEALHA